MAFTRAFTTMSIMVAVSGFNMYPLLPNAIMSEILGISSGCLSALNTTLPCDNDIMGWTQKVDQVYWQESDVTKLCTSRCIDAAGLWKTKVESACASEWLRYGDRYVPADTLSDRISEGLNMACMQDSANQWCLIESYEWVGSDVVQVDCEAFPTDPWCLNRAEFSANQSRMSTLYDDELLCSECFMKQLHARVTSEFLQDTDYAEYLVNEYQDIENICKKSVGELVTRIVPGYPHLTDGPDIGKPAYTPPVTTTPAATPTPTACAGRVVDIRPLLEEELDCHDIAEKYEMASGSLAVATKSDWCKTDVEICIPLACNLYYTQINDTCASLAQTWSNSTTNVTMAQVATWNPSILGACDHLVVGQWVCSGPPGGAWVSPPASEIPDNGEGPVRGGPGSTVSLPIIDDANAVPADKLQEGTPSDCNRWIVANNTQAACWKLANDAKISMQRLFELNPVLGTTGANCASQVWLGYYYCIATPGDGTSPSPTKPITSATPTTGPAKPTQTQSGIDPNCNSFAQAPETGASCWSIANGAGVDLADFYKWNTGLGSNGENCNTQIWPQYYYCVGVATTTSKAPTTTTKAPTTTSSAPKPTRTQTGFPSNCTKWVEAKDGDSCWAISNANGVDLNLFYKLNPVLGEGGANCGSQIWPTYFYCLST